MNLSLTSVKQILLLLNFIFTILGLILNAFGVYILLNRSTFTVDHGENLAGGLVSALGVALVVLSLFGCIAAVHESHNKLIVYIVFIVILMLIQIIMYSLTTLGVKNGLSASVKDGFRILWIYEQDQPGALDYYQDWLHCCGVNDTFDYQYINRTIPKSCCNDHNCHIFANIYLIGCQTKYEEYLSHKMLPFGILSCITIVVEIIATIFGWMMICREIEMSRTS